MSVKVCPVNEMKTKRGAYMQKDTFFYKYSANENEEVMAIRKKYLPREESKLEELKRLDQTVQASGMIESLCAGVAGAAVFGLGFCLVTQMIGNGLIMMILGVVIGIIGIAGMLAAYPIYRMAFDGAKAKYTPRILELAAELTGEKAEQF